MYFEGVRWILIALIAVACWWPLMAVAEKPPELKGTTYDYAYDGKDIGHPERAWLGRAFVPSKTAAAEGKVPLVIFLHGLNAALIKYRWMGGGREGDVRRIIGGLVDEGAIEPVVVAGPSSIVASQVSHGASWNHFDLDNFVSRTNKRLEGIVAIDEERIIVAGHSGAGCSQAGGLEKIAGDKRKLLAIFSIDTCMAASLAQSLARTKPSTHVIVSYQTAAWPRRAFKLFRTIFLREVAKSPPDAEVLRELDHQKPRKAPHEATVALTFERWLPKLLPPKKDDS